ncbi:hypothetical protein [Streptosporangium jomthongense]|uniref:Uncharacterized protein n=1 Tax=Streptosporangium jomthongense TaxID=1193683 RepID=A0ABV8EY87_9ACTN
MVRYAGKRAGSCTRSVPVGQPGQTLDDLLVEQRMEGHGWEAGERVTVLLNAPLIALQSPTGAVEGVVTNAPAAMVREPGVETDVALTTAGITFSTSRDDLQEVPLLREKSR